MDGRERERTGGGQRLNSWCSRISKPGGSSWMNTDGVLHPLCHGLMVSWNCHCFVRRSPIIHSTRVVQSTCVSSLSIVMRSFFFLVAFQKRPKNIKTIWREKKNLSVACYVVNSIRRLLINSWIHIQRTSQWGRPKSLVGRFPNPHQLRRGAAPPLLLSARRLRRRTGRRLDQRLTAAQVRKPFTYPASAAPPLAASRVATSPRKQSTLRSTRLHRPSRPSPLFCLSVIVANLRICFLRIVLAAAKSCVELVSISGAVSSIYYDELMKWLDTDMCRCRRTDVARLWWLRLNSMLSNFALIWWF